MDAVVTPTVMMTAAGLTATVTIGWMSIALRHLHERVCLRHQNHIGVERRERGRRGHTGTVNEDRGKDVAHFGIPSS